VINGLPLKISAVGAGRDGASLAGQHDGRGPDHERGLAVLVGEFDAPPRHSAHRPVHRTGADPVQGILER
jgi:hypothetical protein